MKKQLPTLQHVLTLNSERISEQEETRRLAEKYYNEVRPLMRALGILALFVIIGASFKSLSLGFAFLMVFILVYAILGTLVPTLVGDNYDDKEVKKEIIIRVLECFGTEIEYFPDSCIPLKAIKKGGIHIKDYRTTVQGMHYFRGYYDSNYFQFSYLTVNSSSISEYGGSRNYLIVNFNKHTDKQVIVVQDKLEKHLGYLANNIQNIATNNSLVKLENADFEKKFAVYSKDQIGARYMLSTTMMEKILKLNTKYKNGVNVSFIDGNMHVDIKWADPFFDYTFNLSDDIKMLYGKVYEELFGLFELIEALDLNKKLWSKQD